MVSEAAKQALRDHVAGELAGDLDATMAPVSDSPTWLIPGYRIEGRDGVRALYEMVLDLVPAASTEEILRALDDPNVTRWGDSHCVIEYSDDYPLHRGWVLVVHFDGDRLAGEHGYQTLPEELARVAVSFGADFEDLAGVTRLS
jgi:hypothetical protein